MSDRRDEQRAANAAALAAASRARPIVESGRAVRLGRRQLSWMLVVAAAALALFAGWRLASEDPRPRDAPSSAAAQRPSDQLPSGAPASPEPEERRLRGSVGTDKAPVPKP